MFSPGVGRLAKSQNSHTKDEIQQQFSFQIPWWRVVKVRTVGRGKSAGVWGVGSEALLHEAHEV
ncbi:hypothetical protein, partial [Accumulibacter sp.]|uniref:hypothetical protein n=1 Tax=Accumulibacter sp. TaxID=2053492 RepID=UPI00260FB5FA